MRLVWKSRALRQLEKAAEWSPKQARAVVDAIEQMAQSGWSLGRRVGHGRATCLCDRSGSSHRVIGDDLVVVSVSTPGACGCSAGRQGDLQRPMLSAAGGAVRGEPRLTSTIHLDGRRIVARGIAVMSWGDAALQSVPVAHDTNEGTINGPDDLFAAPPHLSGLIAFVPDVVGVTFPVPIRR